MKESVYIETSILGYLTARSTNNKFISANMEITQAWWSDRRNSFTLYTSQAVVNEVAKGDINIASQRLEILRDFQLLEINQAVRDLAMKFLSFSNLPPKANIDAIHIATATVHNLDYLLTWNCKHIANAQIQKKLAQISRNCNYELPILCTPYELLGE